MKFNFKIQQYQTDAVDAVVKVFNGQGFYDKTNFQSVRVRNSKKGAMIKRLMELFQLLLRLSVAF